MFQSQKFIARFNKFNLNSFPIYIELYKYSVYSEVEIILTPPFYSMLICLVISSSTPSHCLSSSYPIRHIHCSYSPYCYSFESKSLLFIYLNPFWLLLSLPCIFLIWFFIYRKNQEFHVWFDWLGKKCSSSWWLSGVMLIWRVFVFEVFRKRLETL